MQTDHAGKRAVARQQSISPSLRHQHILLSILIRRRVFEPHVIMILSKQYVTSAPTFFPAGRQVINKNRMRFDQNVTGPLQHSANCLLVRDVKVRIQGYSRRLSFLNLFHLVYSTHHPTPCSHSSYYITWQVSWSAMFSPSQIVQFTHCIWLSCFG